MQFEDIVIKGYGSFIDEITFNLQRPGINIIRGKMGSGKTTILSSLFWCLYGEKLKDKSKINTWDELQPDDYTGTKVSINFIIGKDRYQIIRCENYTEKIENKKGGNNIFIYTNGVFSKAKGKRTQQEEINKILGYSPDLFKSAIIFGQKLKRIIEETGPKKKKIFEEAFDMQYIQIALDKTKDDLRGLNQALQKVENQIESFKNTKDVKRTLQKTQKESEKTFSKNKIENLDRISKEMIKLKKKESKITKKLDIVIADYTKPSLQTKILFEKTSILEKTREIYKAETNIKNCKEKIKSLTNNICSECGTKLKVSNQKSSLKAEKLNLKYYKKHLKEIKDNSTEQSENRIKDYNDKIALIDTYKKNSKKLKKVRKNIRKKNEEFKLFKNVEFRIKSKETKKEIVELLTDIRKLKNAKRKLIQTKDILEWLIKDPLSNSGIKAYILDELISKVNDVLHSYSSILGYVISFEIDIDSSQKDFKQYIEKAEGHIVEYYDLSGGQRQLVDTTVAMAIHEVISNIKSTNIMFMDEPFESLDNDGVELISELLKSKPVDKSIFIITHQLSFNPVNSNVISVKLNNNGQSIID